MKKFRNIVVELLCNLRCNYCDYKENYQESNRTIDVGKIIRQLDKMLPNFNEGDYCLRFEGYGEITLYPKLLEYLAKKVAIKHTVEILTNGTCMGVLRKYADKFHWVFSLDGHSEKMNENRGLVQKQIDEIIAFALEKKSDFQCVYRNQSLDEMNDFISVLREQDYQGDLFIFPFRDKEKGIRKGIEYNKLEKARFLPDERYFERWNYIFGNEKRTFVCDLIGNGYVYHVNENQITMNKCDCSWGSFRYEHAFGEERKYKVFPCTTCFTHYEMNNIRRIVSGE